MPKLRKRMSCRVWSREQDNPRQPKHLVAKQELHFPPVPNTSTTDVVVTIERENYHIEIAGAMTSVLHSTKEDNRQET